MVPVMMNMTGVRSTLIGCRSLKLSVKSYSAVGKNANSSTTDCLR